MILRKIKHTAKAFLTGSLLLLATANAYSNGDYRCDQIIEKTAVKICYSYPLKATLYVKFKLNKTDLQKEKHDRKGILFYEEQSIPKRYRATLSDYRNSDFDRSHLAANSDFSYSPKLQKETYSLSVQSPHYPSVNRQAIASIEKLMRRLTISNGQSVIYSGNIFKHINPKRIGKSGIAVPTHFYRVIYFPSTQKSLAFLVENTPEEKSTKASSYRVDLKDLQKTLGYRFAW